MVNLKYTNSKNETIDFSEVGVITDSASIFGRSWKKTTLYNKIVGLSKEVRTYTFTLALVGSSAQAKANNVLNILEKDAVNLAEGKLICGDWYLKGYFTASATSEYKSSANLIKLKLTFMTDADFWVNESKYIYRLGSESGGSSSAGMDFPYNYPYDYKSPMSVDEIVNPNFIESHFILTIYGIADDPKIYIGGHLYHVNVDLGANEYLTINSVDKTIVRTNSVGQKINEFANRDISSYIFQKIPSGSNSVIITPECNVDIVLLNERSEPIWT